jgi:hypothetical protein
MQPNVVYRLAQPMGGLATQINLLQPRGLVATHRQSVIYQQRGVAMRQVPIEIEPKGQGNAFQIPSQNFLCESFLVKQAKIKSKCHRGSGISKLIFFIESTFNSKKKSDITSLVYFTTIFFLPKRAKFTKWPPKLSGDWKIERLESIFILFFNIG